MFNEQRRLLQFRDCNNFSYRLFFKYQEKCYNCYKYILFEILIFFNFNILKSINRSMILSIKVEVGVEARLFVKI